MTNIYPLLRVLSALRTRCLSRTCRCGTAVLTTPYKIMDNALRNTTAPSGPLHYLAW